MNEDAMKRAVKEALKEWLDEKLRDYTSTVGKWVLCSVGAAILAAFVYLIMWANGWRQP